MLKKTITFEDLDGNPITEDFYFNISKADLAEMEFSQKGGMQDHLNAIVKAEDGKEIMRIFKEIIAMAVGKRSEDGRRFIKTEDIRDEFLQTDAYSVLFMELVTDAGKGAEFITAIMPGDLAAKVAAGERVTDLPIPEEEMPAWMREDREPNPRELQLMTKDEMQAAFRYRAEKATRDKNPQ